MSQRYGVANFPAGYLGTVTVNGGKDETLRMEAGLSILRSTTNAAPQACALSLSGTLGFQLEAQSDRKMLKQLPLPNVEFAHVFPSDPTVCCFLINPDASDSAQTLKQSELVALVFESVDICTHIYIQTLALLGMVSKKRRKRTSKILKVVLRNSKKKKKAAAAAAAAATTQAAASSLADVAEVDEDALAEREALTLDDDQEEEEEEEEEEYDDSDAEAASRSRHVTGAAPGRESFVSNFSVRPTGRSSTSSFTNQSHHEPQPHAQSKRLPQCSRLGSNLAIADLDESFAPSPVPPSATSQGSACSFQSHSQPPTPGEAAATAQRAQVYKAMLQMLICAVLDPESVHESSQNLVATVLAGPGPDATRVLEDTLKNVANVAQGFKSRFARADQAFAAVRRMAVLLQSLGEQVVPEDFRWLPAPAEDPDNSGSQDDSLTFNGDATMDVMSLMGRPDQTMFPAFHSPAQTPRATLRASGPTNQSLFGSNERSALAAEWDNDGDALDTTLTAESPISSNSPDVLAGDEDAGEVSDMSYAQQLTSMAVTRMNSLAKLDSTAGDEPAVSPVVGVRPRATRARTSLRVKMQTKQREARMSLNSVSQLSDVHEDDLTIAEGDESLAASSPRPSDPMMSASAPHAESPISPTQAAFPEFEEPDDLPAEAEPAQPAELAQPAEQDVQPQQQPEGDKEQVAEDERKIKLERVGSNLLVISGSTSNLIEHLLQQAIGYNSQRVFDKFDEQAIAVRVAKLHSRRLIPFELLGRDSAGNLNFIDSFLLTYRTHMTGPDLLQRLTAAAKTSDELAGQ